MFRRVQTLSERAAIPRPSHPSIPHLVLAEEGVAVAGGVHVLVAVEDEAHGAAQVPRRDGRRDRHVHRARLLAAKPAAEALCSPDNFVGRDAQRVRHMHLVVRWPLQ